MRAVRKEAWALCVALLLPACGDGNGDELTVILDPGYRLLRDDLPAPGSGQALQVEGRWGRFYWAPDVPAQMAFGSRLELLGGPVPPVVIRTAVTLALDPVARSLEGQAEIELAAEGAELSSAQFLLSAAGVDEVQAENPAATFSYGESVLTVAPLVPVPVGESWTVTVSWHDRDVELTTASFPEWFAKDVLVGYIGEPSTFFTFGYWFWPRLTGAETLTNLEFTVTYPGDLTLVLSGEHTSTVDNGDDTRTDRWTLAHPVRYHVSLALAEYEKVSGTCGSTEIEVYGMPIGSEYPIVPATYIPVLESICNDFRARFGEPAFGTIRLAGVDERFTNGYSSPTLIIVPNYTWDDDGTGSFPARDFYLAHEVSHQWWGNDVFMASMADAWLTEGMADYSAITYLKNALGEEQAEYFWLDDAKLLLDYYQQGGRDHPLVPDVLTAMEPVIYYLKGAWVLRMLEGVIGEDSMGTALRGYREAHPFTAATTQDFIDAAETAAGEDLGWFFEQWLSGTGVLSLQETHRERGGNLEVTVTQTTPWLSDPKSFYKMPLTVRLEQGKKSIDHPVTISGAESIHVLQKP